LRLSTRTGHGCSAVVSAAFSGRGLVMLTRVTLCAALPVRREASGGAGGGGPPRTMGP
jgi:hypothetical protein